VLAACGTAATAGLAGCNAFAGSDDATAVHDGDWLSYGNGPTNANSVAGGLPEPTTHTELARADWPLAPPVVHDGVAYLARQRVVTAVTVTGDEQWTSRLDREVSGAPAVDPDRRRLYVPTRTVGSTDGPDPPPASVTVLSLAEGAVLDTYRVGEGRTYGVTVVNGDVYVRSASSCRRLGPDGTERWSHPLDPLRYDEFNLGDGTATQVAPAVTGDGLYVPGRNALVKLDRDSGAKRWRLPVDSPYSAPVVGDDMIVQTGWQETVAATPAGDVRWRRGLQSLAAAAVDGAVYVVANDLHELDPTSGETNWQEHLPSEGTAAPVVTGDAVLVVSSGVNAFRRDGGGILGPGRQRWRSSSVHAIDYSSPVVAAGRVFVTTAGGLVALHPAADT
jgi:outer membrane protein assembly factor BamB